MTEPAPKRLVRVAFKKSLSDGNDGNESAEVYLDWYVEDQDDSHTDLEVAEEMLRNARDLVHNALARSPSSRVRQSLQPPSRTAVTVPPEYDDDD